MSTVLMVNLLVCEAPLEYLRPEVQPSQPQFAKAVARRDADIRYLIKSQDKVDKVRVGDVLGDQAVLVVRSEDEIRFVPD
jgi:hypothetical protein